MAQAYRNKEAHWRKGNRCNPYQYIILGSLAQQRNMENLTALNISSVSLYGRITLEDDGRDKLSGILGKHNINWPRQGVDKLGLYESGAVRQHIGPEVPFTEVVGVRLSRTSAEGITSVTI